MCEEDEFQCDDKCVNYSQTAYKRCDGVVDCWGSTDELDCGMYKLNQIYIMQHSLYSRV